MTPLIVGIGHLLVGTAYALLGLLSAWEAATQYRSRGLSRFGLGFSLMAASCGPHHLVHGWCVLQGDAVTAPMLAVTLLGLPAGLVFCWLRVEAMREGTGDRRIVARPHLMITGMVAWLGTVGALAGWSIASPPGPGQAVCTTGRLATAAGVDFTSPVLLANVFVTLTYAMVGWYLIETQARRYMAYRAWSLSGLSLAAIFPTCAAMHLITAFTSGPDAATLPFDLLGVPASVYFLWVVRRLHMDSVVDWNRRPLVGVATMPSRSAPWSD